MGNKQTLLISFFFFNNDISEANLNTKMVTIYE